MGMNILITGITGSGGSYLADYILENHPEVNVYGICRWHSTSSFHNISHIKNKIQIYECDLLDLSSIIRTLKEVQPERIFHLASFANVRKCFDTPLSVINNNIMGTANLLEAVRLTCIKSIVQICSTSEVYGNPQTVPIKEDHPLIPVNPYSVSKLTQDKLAYAYHKSWGLNVVITRAFAYINPRREDLFASAFAKQVVEIENYQKKILHHGNLESTRTLIDVRDMMRAYWIACDKCVIGEPYNIGGIDILTVGDFLDRLKERSTAKIVSKVDSNLLRPVDVTNQICDSSKFINVTGFKQKYSLDESIDFLLNYYRERIKDRPWD